MFKKKRPATIQNVFLTLYRSPEVCTVIKLVTNNEEFGYTTRLLFRKVGIALDKHLVNIPERNKRMEILEDQLVHFRLNQRKMKLGNIERLANIEEIWKTHEQVRKLGKDYTDDIEMKKICQKDHEGEFQLLLDYLAEN